MFILVSGATRVVRALAAQKHPNLGVLLTPADWNTPPEQGSGVVWACDNGAYSGFDEPIFRSLLKKVKGRSDCQFFAAPDVVANAEETLILWKKWRPIIKDYGITPAFVCQDGCLMDDVPWDETSAIFIGGSTQYKLGYEVARILGKAYRANLWTHMGRVNTLRRLLYAAALQVRSVDGSAFSKFSETHLPWALHAAGQQPLVLGYAPSILKLRSVRRKNPTNAGT